MTVAVFSGPPAAIAGGEGRTVCVMRCRPVAIQPQPRPIVTFEGNVMSPTFRPAAQASGVGPFPTYYPNYALAWRVPVIYGHVNPRLHYVSPILRNGYVGGMQNLPTPYVNILPNFTRAPGRFAPNHGGGRPGGGGGMGGPGGGGRPGGGGGGGHGGGGK